MLRSCPIEEDAEGNERERERSFQSKVFTAETEDMPDILWLTLTGYLQDTVKV